MEINDKGDYDLIAVSGNLDTDVSFSIRFFANKGDTSFYRNSICTIKDKDKEVFNTYLEQTNTYIPGQWESKIDQLYTDKIKRECKNSLEVTAHENPLRKMTVAKIPHYSHSSRKPPS